MGWRILERVLDGAPDELTFRERRALEVLAFTVLDPPHEQAGVLRGIEQNPKILRRLRLGRTERFAVLARLVELGQLERAERGRNTVSAVYVFPGFGKGPGNPDAKPDRVRETRTLETGEASGFHPGSIRETRTGSIRVSETHLISETERETVGDVVARSGARARETTTHDILAAFIDWDRAAGGQLTRRTTGQLAKAIGDLLAEGIHEKHIRQGLADWRPRGQHPSTLHSFVDAAMNGHPRTPVSRKQAETDTWFAQSLERARRLDAQEGPQQ